MKMLLPVLADFANGIFAVVIAGYVTDVDVVWWHFLVGIALAMCPDIDAVPELLRNGRVGASKEHNHDHRELLHYPILFLFIGIVVTYFNMFWGVLFITSTMLHFLNDLYGTGWGVPLFWPLTSDRYKLFTSAENSFSFTAKDLIRRIPKHNLSREIEKHGIDNWIDEFYLKANPVSVVEYILFTLALVLLIVTLLY